MFLYNVLDAIHRRLVKKLHKTDEQERLSSTTQSAPPVRRQRVLNKPKATRSEEDEQIQIALEQSLSEVNAREHKSEQSPKITKKRTVEEKSDLEKDLDSLLVGQSEAEGSLATPHATFTEESNLPNLAVIIIIHRKGEDISNEQCRQFKQNITAKHIQLLKLSWPDEYPFEKETAAPLIANFLKENGYGKAELRIYDVL